MRTANHKGQQVNIIRFSTKNCRICPSKLYEKRNASDVPWSESCELVPTSELSNIKVVKEEKKKAAKKPPLTIAKAA